MAIFGWPAIDAWWKAKLEELIPPKAAHNEMTIAVALLDHDDDGYGRTLIQSDFSERDYFRLILLDRKVTLENGETAAQQQAQDILKEVGADALVWGVINGRTPKLYLSTANGNKAKGKIYVPSTNFTLPQVYWDEVPHMLSDYIELGLMKDPNAILHNKKLAEDVSQDIQKTRQFLMTAKLQSQDQINVEQVLAEVLTTYNNLTQDSDGLREAADLLSHVLAHIDRTSDPPRWAQVQFATGAANFSLGSLTTNTVNIVNAESAFEFLLEMYSPTTNPLAFARVKRYLCAVHRVYAEQIKSVSLALTAIDDCDSALKVISEDVSQHEFAVVMTERGLAYLTAYRSVGGVGRDPAEDLNCALNSLERAESVARRLDDKGLLGVVELDRASAFLAAYERYSRLDDLTRTRTKLKNSLRFYTRSQYPSKHAAIMLSLGRAEKLLYERTKSRTSLSDARTSFNTALEICNDSRVKRCPKADIEAELRMLSQIDNP